MVAEFNLPHNIFIDNINLCKNLANNDNMNLVILRIIEYIYISGILVDLIWCKFGLPPPLTMVHTFLLKKLGLDVDFYLSSSFDLTDVSKEFLYQSSILSRLCVAKCRFLVFAPSILRRHTTSYCPLSW